MSKRGYKKVPSYWWDFRWDFVQKVIVEVIVESDSPKFPVVARYKLGIDQDATAEIETAEAYIADLEAGRATPKAV